MSLYFMSALYVLSGINHFVYARFYFKMMPPWVPAHALGVYGSGVAEVLLGIGLLLEPARAVSAWGIIVLLILVFPANVYMYTSGKFRRFPSWLLLLRLPLQFVLIWWAYQFT